LEKLVIIPTYNEKDNIRKIIAAVFDLKQNFHVLIIDDGSPDGTGNIVKELQARHPGILFLEERTGKLGLGTAYIHGFKWALAKGYQYIFEMDADFSHAPADLVRLHHACAVDGADLSVGSRYVKGGGTKNWPWNRALLSYGASVYVRLVTWIHVKDATAGFVCYKREVLEAINLDGIQFVGYAFQIEMKFTAWKLGFKVVEVPITFIERVEGYSKMSKNIVKEGVLGVLKIQWQSIFRNYAGRVKNENN
jgi:dolichol-phosphate mannosyltransferase